MSKPTTPTTLTVWDWQNPPSSRPFDVQLNDLTREQRAAFDELKTWNNKEERPVPFDDRMILRLLRASPGATKFNVVTAKKVAENLSKWSKKIRLDHLSIRDVRSQLETGTLVIPGNYNRDGHLCLYMKPALYWPGKQSLSGLLRSLVYLLQVMSEDEKTQTEGLSFIANMQDWGFSNFSVGYAKAFFDTMQGRYPIRVRQFIICGPPSWFGMIWKIIRGMMSKEFAEKIVMPPTSQASQFFPDLSHVPKELGGTLDLNDALTKFIKYRYQVEGLDYNAPYPKSGEIVDDGDVVADEVKG
jgi:hypothetical protein